jgi:ATP-dependent Clp protease ATP-binding subunit ClpC
LWASIGATTVGEYRRYIESDRALARRFTPVWIEEPSEEEAIEIVKEVAEKHLAPTHHVTYPKEVIEEAVRLAVRYLHDEFLPGKAIKLLDQAGPRVMMGGSLSGLGDAEDQDAPGQVTVEIVREIVAERTGIPLTRLTEDEAQKLLRLEAELKGRVKGQHEAVTQVARVVKRARAGLADPRRPFGVFLFAGPTGVGKTELALALAEVLFDEEDAILRLDMSEYMEKHQVSRLIGAPPGYVGYEEEGQLTGRLRRRPYSVVLLDEMERAHPDVQHLFLQLFDAGRLTDARGNLVNGRNAIFAMTTNLGAKEALGFADQRTSYREKLQAAIEEHFTPEFLNRVDRVIYFEPLSKGALLKIFDKLFAQVQERLQTQNIQVEITEDFKQQLCERYTDTKRGARDLQRAIEDEIVVPLTDRLLAGKIKPGERIQWPTSGGGQPD